LRIVTVTCFAVLLATTRSWFLSRHRAITDFYTLSLHDALPIYGVWLRSLTSRGLYAWILGICITGFYIILYFFPQYLGLRYQGSNTGLIALFDPLSRLLSGNPDSQ